MLRQAARTVARRRIAYPRLQPCRSFLEPPSASPPQQQAVQAASPGTSSGQAQSTASSASPLTATAAAPAAVEAATGAKPKAAHRKLIEKERQRAAAASGAAQAPQLLVSNVVDKGKGRAVDEGDASVPISAGSATQSSPQQGAAESSATAGKEPLLEGEWLRKRQQTVGEAGASSNGINNSEEGPRSFAEHASTSTPVGNSLLVTLPPSAAQGQASYAADSQQAGTEGSTSRTGEVGFLPFLPLRSVPIPTIRHPFNTNRFVNTLETRGEFKRSTAEEIMRATKALLTVAEEDAARDLVAKTDLENEAYLFSAALSELRTEVQMTARTDGIALRSLNAQLQREVDSLSQKMREDMNSLKNDNQLDLNNRKEEASTDINTIEQRIMDTNSKFILLVGDTRAALEANKWIQTRRSIGKAQNFALMPLSNLNALL